MFSLKHGYNDCEAGIIPASVRVEQSETDRLGEPCASPRRDTMFLAKTKEYRVKLRNH